MRVLVVYCHPVPESFCAALRSCVVNQLSSAQHEVDVLDLYAEEFRPAMRADERRHYEDPTVNKTGLETHIDRLKRAEALIFIYPTWWYGLPAMLKGWLDRVFLPDVAFSLPEDGQPIRPMLQNVRKLAVVTTCGAPWLLSFCVGQPGRKTLLRGLRLLCHPRCQTSYLAHYKMDASTAKSRKAYLQRVARAMARF